MDVFLSYLFQYIIYLGVLILIVLLIKTIIKKRLETHHSNWNNLITDFKYSTQEFYKLLEEELDDHDIHGLQIKEVRLKEGNMFSTRRLYLRVEWREYQYDMCAAPFGDGFFLSWWLLFKKTKREVIISRIPFLGNILLKALYPITFYKVDTASMFMSYCHSSVLKVMDDITKESGKRIGANERKPIMTDFFKR